MIENLINNHYVRDKKHILRGDENDKVSHQMAKERVIDARGSCYDG